jgi:hypothetical protein
MEYKCKFCNETLENKETLYEHIGQKHKEAYDKYKIAIRFNQKETYTANLNKVKVDKCPKCNMLLLNVGQKLHNEIDNCY